MDWFEKIKRYYDQGRYTKEQVRVFVEQGKITEAEYEQIVGEPFNEVVTLKATRTRKATK